MAYIGANDSSYLENLREQCVRDHTKCVTECRGDLSCIAKCDKELDQCIVDVVTYMSPEEAEKAVKGSPGQEKFWDLVIVLIATFATVALIAGLAFRPK